MTRIPKAGGLAGDLLTDLAEADDAERLAGELDALPLGALPLTLLHGRVGLGNVAGQSHQQGDRVLGRGNRVRIRSVGDDDALARRGLDIHVVDAHACASR